jgi:cold shock CspA family protein/ribosome-associated translation inhibitor RaiA
LFLEKAKMKLPLQITFHGLSHSEPIADYASKRARKLDTFFERIMSCRIAVEAPHRHKHEGRPYRVRIDLGVPGDEIVVGREVGGRAKEDVYATIDTAFDEAQRKLEDYVRRRRGDVKKHESSRHGVVVKLFSYEGYGFLEAEDGSEVYFHKNSVRGHGFARMHRGDRVRFVEATGEDGIHASFVALLPRRRKRTATAIGALGPGRAIR